MAFDLKAFLMPSWQKALVFIAVALVLVPAIFYLSHSQVCYGGSMQCETCTAACYPRPINLETWKEDMYSGVYYLYLGPENMLAGYVNHGLDLLSIPLLSWALSYFVACALAYFLATRHAKKGRKK